MTPVAIAATLSKLWNFPIDSLTYLLDSCDERGGCVETGAYLWQGLRDCGASGVTMELEAAKEGLVGLYPKGRQDHALLLREAADGSCTLSIGPWERVISQLWSELTETES